MEEKLVKHWAAGRYKDVMELLRKQDRALVPTLLVSAARTIPVERKEGLLLSLGYSPTTDGDIYALFNL